MRSRPRSFHDASPAGSVAGSTNDRVNVFTGAVAFLDEIDDGSGWALEAGTSVNDVKWQPAAAGGHALPGAPRATEPHAASADASEPRRQTKRRCGTGGWTYQGAPTELRNMKFDAAMQEQDSEDAVLEYLNFITMGFWGFGVRHID